MERRFGKIGGMAQQGVKNAAANLTRLGVIAGGAIALAVRGGIQSLAELERANQQTGAVIESTGGKAGVTAAQVRELAESLESVTTADDKAIQSGENLLLTFTGIGKDIFPQATKAMVDMSIAMAQGDVASADFKATAIQVGKALNDPIRGATALRRVGVQLTEQQEKQIKKFVESGDVMKAQQIILAELEREFGKAGAAAGEGFGGDLRRLDDAFEDTRMALATGFLPVIRKVSDWLTKKLMDPNVQADIRKFGDTLAGAFDRILEVGKNIPWSQIGDSLKLAGAGAKAVFDAFTMLPPWVQQAVITGWGLNKLTGGALGSIVGELGKGLVKGVLGMTAGVVNIKAGAVTGMGGVGGGAAGTAATSGVAYQAGRVIGTAMKVFGVLAIAELANQLEPQISGLGSELGRKVPALLAERLALGKQIGELYWPFGPKGAPEWAGGTGVFGDGGHLMGTQDRVSHAPAPGTPITRTGHGSTQTAEEQRSAINWDKIKENTERSNTKLSNLDSRIREARAAQVSSAERSRAAIVAAERSGTSSIVSAIRGIQRPIVSVSVVGNTVRTVYRTGGTIARNVSTGSMQAGLEA